MELFEQGKVKLYRGDCMELMAQYPDGYFDLAIVDPPYGIGEDGRNNHTRNKLAKARDYREYTRYDDSIPDSAYFKELFRVSKNQVIFGGNYFIEHLSNTSCFIVWDKDNSGDFADCELAWTSFKTAVRKIKFRWNGMLQQDMKNKETRIHPNQKPISVYWWIISEYTNITHKILDTHLGSGSSAIAADKSPVGEFVGVEIDPVRWQEAVKRFKENTKQTTLFAA